MGRRVVLVDTNYPDTDIEQEVLTPWRASLEPIVSNGDRYRIREAVRGADAVLVREAPLDQEAISAMEKCRVIVRYGVGVDNIDLEAAAKRRIFVANVPDYGTEEVSDHALALLLAVGRRIVQADHRVRAGEWTSRSEGAVYRLAGKVLGIVGFGRIGRAFYRKARGFRFDRVLVYDPLVDAARMIGDDESLVNVDIDELCAAADMISLHAPLTMDTHHLISRSRIAQMRPNAIVINTSRGGLVDEGALAEALSSGRILGAGIDVFESEPPEEGNPLLGLENVVLTGHAGWYSEESMIDLRRQAATAVARVFAGQPPESWVNRWN